MPSALLPVVFAVGIFAIVYFSFWLLVSRGLDQERKRRKPPFTRDLLRGPGESCFRKLEELDDKRLDWVIGIAVGLGMLIGILMGATLPELKSYPSAILLSTVALVGLIYGLHRIRDLIRERRRCALGAAGERHTAQALQPLLAQGYEMFHDLGFKDANGKSFNIDHVLVGPAGVIAVETKARSKDAAGNGKEHATVKYDGKEIRFSNGRETQALEQVLANARFLSKELTTHTGEKVFVHPVVSLPGWWVDQVAPKVNPYVQNPVSLVSWISNLSKPPQDPAQRKRMIGFPTKAAAPRNAEAK